MPTHKSAWKRMRQNERRRVQNKAYRSYLRKTVKSIKTLDDPGAASEQLPGAISTIDRMAKKGIIHHRTAARMKSRLTRRIRGA